MTTPTRTREELIAALEADLAGRPQVGDPLPRVRVDADGMVCLSDADVERIAEAVVERINVDRLISDIVDKVAQILSESWR